MGRPIFAWLPKPHREAKLSHPGFGSDQYELWLLRGKNGVQHSCCAKVSASWNLVTEIPDHRPGLAKGAGRQQNVNRTSFCWHQTSTKPSRPGSLVDPGVPSPGKRYARNPLQTRKGCDDEGSGLSPSSCSLDDCPKIRFVYVYLRLCADHRACLAVSRAQGHYIARYEDARTETALATRRAMVRGTTRP